MATYTREQLVTEAAECLLIVSAGNSVDDEDAEKIDGQVDALLAQLSADEIVTVTDEDAIPAEFFKALGELLANASATKFGKPYDTNKKNYFEGQLSRTTYTRPTFETASGEYF